MIKNKSLFLSCLFVTMSSMVQAKMAVTVKKEAEPITPIKVVKIQNPAMVELGKKLYFDPRLSKSGVISCNTCHNLAMGGSDNLVSSVGHKWNQGPINSPTVLNSRYNIAQFWDGRAKDLKEQAGGPIANPGEMASSPEVAVNVLNSIPAYVSEFKKIFKHDVITLSDVTDAIAAFEETLVTPNARFDQWLRGNKKAITEYELSGYKIFKNKGCVSCHNGEAVGGGMYQKVGVFEQFKTTNPSTGRFGVTKNEEDRMFFKVPILRNIELTYPYFHDGSAKSLKEAVTTMARIQLGEKLNDDEADRIVAFLKTLTGEQPKIVMPLLPPSNEKTPEPEPFDKKN